MEHLSNDHKDRPNQFANSHKLYDETGHPVLNLMEIQWKLRQQHDQNFIMEGKPKHQNTQINPTEQDCQSYSQRSK